MTKDEGPHEPGDDSRTNEELVRDQREANERMVHAVIRAQEHADEAQQAQELSEKNARELREVAEFREMFLGIVGHDLRNPLTAILVSAATLIQRGRLDDLDAVTVMRIINASQRMTRMITQLLDLTRTRLGGGLPLEPTSADLGEICRSIVEEFHEQAKLQIEGDLKGTWDQDRLAEALSNLVRNGIEYTRPETFVLIEAYSDGTDVVVEISNEGDPIPDEVREIMFEPFGRGNQHARSASDNLGLGLYIANQIVLAHGGTLDAKSSGGRTTFVMRVPRGSATSSE